MKLPDGKKIKLYTAIGQRIREVAAEHNMTVTQLAHKVGSTPSSMNHICSNGYPCPVHLLVSIAELFDCTLDHLVPCLTGKEDAA